MMVASPQRGVILALAAMVLFVTSCSSRSPSRPDALGSPTPSNTSSPVTGVASTLSPPATVPGSTARPSGRPSTSSSPTPGSQGTPISIQLSDCIERNEPATAIIRTVPGSMISASATYSDGEAHNNFWVGVTDPRGEYPVTWTPPLEAPSGDGKFLVAAQSEQEGANSAVKGFRLAGPGGCS